LTYFSKTLPVVLNPITKSMTSWVQSFDNYSSTILSSDPKGLVVAMQAGVA
jgi:hypothetical protein